MARVVASVLLLAMLAIGCSSSRRATAELWVEDHGGVVAGKSRAQTRLQTVSRPLITACCGRKISVQILATDAVTAYSLWDGHVFVTRGLMNHLDNAELQAAVAHELGHLLSDGHVQTIASLRGCCDDPDCEVRADAAGAQLLRAQGLSPDAMPSMLQKIVRFGALSPTCTRALQHRIGLLSESLDDPPR